MSLFEDGGAGTVVTDTWHGAQVQAWKPARLSERDFALGPAEVRATEQAVAAIRAADRALPSTWEALSRLLLRHEGVASSGIEGLREPLVRVLMAERTGTGGAAGWVADNLAVIDTALATAHEPLSVEMLHSWHALLMRNSNLDPELIGTLRPRIGWVGGSSPLTAAYVPPPPCEIGDLIDDLIGFANERTDLDPISHTALLHAQFEAIHPYGDGNGRLGRVLISRALRRSGLTCRSTVPLSVAIARDTGGYLSGLHLFEQGHTGRWIAWFAGVAKQAATITEQLTERTLRIIDTWNDRLSGLRADSAARALVPLLVNRPLQSAPDAAALLNITRPAARTALRTLTGRGILTALDIPTPGAGRNRHWYAAHDLIDTWTP